MFFTKLLLLDDEQMLDKITNAELNFFYFF